MMFIEPVFLILIQYIIVSKQRIVREKFEIFYIFFSPRAWDSAADRALPTESISNFNVL
jgi:hypothetical protein